MSAGVLSRREGAESNRERQGGCRMTPLVNPLVRIRPALLRRRIVACELSSLAIDDLHQAAIAEFDRDEAAVRRLNAAYIDARLRYLAELAIIRAERESEECA
jgi:hypothetical protein